MEVNAQAQATGIYATVPIPKNWPEQTVEIIDRHESKNISRFKIDDDDDDELTRQIEFQIGRLVPGQSETTYVRLKITKHFKLAPQDTSVFQLPGKATSETRAFLKPSPYIESRHKRIRAIADQLKDDSLSAWDQVEKNYRWVRDNIEYKFDRTIRSCLEALDNSQGDCEEMSSLFIAICRAQDIPARAVWIPDHTYPEFYLVDSEGQGHWFPCQVAGNYQFGEMIEVRPILQKGDRFKVKGHKEELRYIQPTLIARDSAGQIGVKFIRREIDE